MLNTASLNAVSSSKFSQHFLKPLYNSYCFSGFPATITYLLGGNGTCSLPADVFGDLPTRYDKVIFMFIDAFGWRFFEHYAEKYTFLKTVFAQGMVSKLTSQFPSTTAAHITCIHTGLDVGQSGVYEWTYYEPLVDALISPLLFSYAGDTTKRDTLKQVPIPPEKFFPQQTFYDMLQAQGIISHVLQYQGYTPSTYSNIAFRGARVHSYASIQEALVYLSQLVQAQAPPAYFFLYFDRIDMICHHYGPFSKEFEASVDTFFTMLEQLFYQPIHGTSDRTLLMLTADHGQVEVNPKTTYYLNKEMPHIGRYLKTNQQGHTVAVGGSPRDAFLYVKEEYIDEAIAELQQRLAGRAEVYHIQELLDQHFFGTQAPSPALLDRLGNVVILPYQHETIWWYEEGKQNMHFLGHHGGLTPEEMEIPLLLLPL